MQIPLWLGSYGRVDDSALVLEIITRDHNCICHVGFCSSWQILRDVPKARREVDLHWRVAAHENIVNLIDIYENVYMGQRSLLVVMEWYVVYMYPHIFVHCMYTCIYMYDALIHVN